MKTPLFGTFLCVLFPACNGEEPKPPGPVSPAEGEGEGGEGEGQGEGEGEGEGPVCACAVNADCDDGNFCNGAETCNCSCSPGTPPDCADEFECTEDRCANNTCVNVPAHARCGEGKICRPAEGGCVAPPPCRDNADCVTDDPCQVGACDAATRACAFTPFDGDEDGHAPRVCGGDDCDDSKGRVRPGHPEECNGRDDNCDGVVDEGINFATTEHCGSCDNHCPETTICQNSQCVCREGEELCGGGCVLLTSPEHCGRCGNQCHEGATCENGECRCPNGLENCGNGCIDTQTNHDNCGECGNWCGWDTECHGGACVCVNDDLRFCNGACISVTDDSENCGACGNVCAAEAVTPGGRRDNVWCIDGDCQCHTDVRPFCAQCEGRCVDDHCYAPTRLVACGEQCVNLVNDPEHCGECGNTCDENAICTEGQCEACPGGAMRCNNEVGFYCACGACDTVCSELEACADGTCVCSLDADSCELDGVEYCTDVSSDPWNCGRCDNVCPEDRICQDGNCVPVN